jgi:lipopolysaccharide/colanic/teichoic acid biosynthesis glycosyltransferase
MLVESAVGTFDALVPSSAAALASGQRATAYESCKRLLDLLLATLALALLWPVFVITAVAIKLSSRGPVFFLQTRVGRDGREFRCYKFRSMVRDAETWQSKLAVMNLHADARTFKMRRDPRVTRVGEIIRKTSIDELPQLLNVVKGDMSIVGPRPPLPREVAEYGPRERRRLEVTPGLTCIWQVCGRGDIPFPEQVEMDLSYVEHRNLFMDLKLILLTFPAVICGKGAY